MRLNQIVFGAATVLPVVGIVLVLANWYAKPDAAFAWVAPIVMFVIMLVVLHGPRLALRRSMSDDASLRSVAWIMSGVVFGALIMIVPLAVTLARSYGVVDDPDLGRRSSGVLIGAFLVMLGNVMPKNLPPLSSMACNGARMQAFQRLAGWTWVLCGLGMAVAWLALSIDFAEMVSTALVVAAMAVTIVQLLRLRRPRRSAPLTH